MAVRERIHGAAVVPILLLIAAFGCATVPPAAVETPAPAAPLDRDGEQRQEAPPVTSPTPIPPPPEKAWAHVFVTDFSPPWEAKAADPAKVVVVPVLPGDEAPRVLQVGLWCSILSWNATGTMRFKVEVSGYPSSEAGGIEEGVLEMSVTPKRHSLTADKLLTVEVPAPQGFTAYSVRVTRDPGSDTLNQDPAVRVLRVSY